MNNETNYAKDKEALLTGVFRWVFTTLAVIAISLMGAIYNRMEDMTIYVTESKKDIQHIQEKDKEQDTRLQLHDEALFLKPEEVRIKIKRF